MKVIVAGSRNIDSKWVVSDAIENSPWRLDSSSSPFAQMDKIYELVHGGARGVDTIAAKIAEERNTTAKQFAVSTEEYNKKGDSAFYDRNIAMAEYADALIAIWDHKSDGTRNMIDIALDHGLDVYVKVVNPQSLV